MGLLDVSFGIFCEGLGANVGLQVLDLRSNQINHNEASNLANALKTNTNLKALGKGQGRICFVLFVIFYIVLGLG